MYFLIHYCLLVIVLDNFVQRLLLSKHQLMFLLHALELLILKLLQDMFLHFAHSLPTQKRPYCNHFPMLLRIFFLLDRHNKLLLLQSQLQRLFLLLYTMLWFLIFYSLKFPPYLQNLCFPIVTVIGLDHIHLFVAVAGLK